MNILFLMILISVVLAFGFLLAFIWANNQKQFDDLVTPAIRILFDDSKIKNETTVDEEAKNVNK